MKIAPLYGKQPIMRLGGAPSAANVAMVRQRRRFVRSLAELSEEQWATKSRCDDWTVQDVVAHLAGTDVFWLHSIRAGLGGAPTKILADFDPKATPAAMVAAVRDASPADTLASFADASTALCELVASLDDDACAMTAESPAGHVPISVLVHHALWDAWVHERDVFTALGLSQDREPDELVACLRFVAALGPAIALQYEPKGAATLEVIACDPSTRFTVRVDGDVRVSEHESSSSSVVLRGDAVELIEALSVRVPFPHEIDGSDAWLVNGLRIAFE